MPRKYVPKRKRQMPYRNKRFSRQMFKPKAGLSRAVMPFTREVETYFHLSDLTGNGTAPFSNLQHTGDGGVVGQINVNLADMPGHTDFTNLFRQYKLNYMKITMIPSANTVSGGETRDVGGNYANNQILIRTCLNRTGIAIGAGNTISEWSQIQAKKQWVLARDKPTVITCKLSQLVGVGTTAEIGGNPPELIPAIVKPRYISTNNPS